MFFPGSGGRPTKAKEFCTDCPFKAECLEEAALNGLLGFWAGYTDAERSIWAKHHRLLVQISEPDYGSRKILVPVKTKETHQWMDEVEPSDAEIFALELAG